MRRENCIFRLPKKTERARVITDDSARSLPPRNEAAPYQEVFLEKKNVWRDDNDEETRVSRAKVVRFNTPRKAKRQIAPAVCFFLGRHPTLGPCVRALRIY